MTICYCPTPTRGTTNQHDHFCGIKQDFFTSECEFPCDYYKEAVAECIELGEHMRMTTIDSRKGDVCFNCGTN